MNARTERPPGYTVEREEFESVLSDTDTEGEGAIAVLSEPFGGREQFLDDATTYFGERATRLQCSPTAEGAHSLDFGDADVVVIDDCQHLFTRRIGGFEDLDRFLRRVEAFDGLVVTSWNTFSWEYLVVVKNLERTFPTQIRLEELDSQQIRALLLREYEHPEFVDDSESTAELLMVRREYPLSFGGNRTVRLPYVVPNREELARRVARSNGGTIETRIFDQITQRANGNLGVARHLWEGSIEDGRLTMSAIPESVTDLGLDYDTEFLVQVLVTHERIPYGTLADVVEHPELDRVLSYLSRQGVLTVEDDMVVLRPDGLNFIVESLTRRRLIW